MPIVIKKVTRRCELKAFINFSESLYRDCEYYVPKLYFDQFNTLSPNRNPASEFCESALFLAYKDGVLVGRVAERRIAQIVRQTSRCHHCVDVIQDLIQFGIQFNKFLRSHACNGTANACHFQTVSQSVMNHLATR